MEVMSLEEMESLLEPGSSPTKKVLQPKDAAKADDKPLPGKYVLPPFENGNLMPSHLKGNTLLKNFTDPKNSLRT